MLIFTIIVSAFGLIAMNPFESNTNQNDKNEIELLERMNNKNNNIKPIHFNGQNYIEINDHDDFSASTTGELTITFWMRPTTTTYENSLSSGYIHFLGKGEPGKHEWVFRMYSDDNTAKRDNRISYYLYNNSGGLGAGSYFQEPVRVGEWIHVTMVFKEDKVHLYKNGKLMDIDDIKDSKYNINPQNSNAPVRIGTREMKSFFEGDIYQLAFFNKALETNEISYISKNMNINFNENTNGYTSGNFLVAWYKLDDKLEIVKDHSGNGHNGFHFNMKN